MIFKKEITLLLISFVLIVFSGEAACSSSWNAKEWHEKATVLLQRQEYGKAIEAYTEAINLEPNPSSYMLRGYGYFFSKKYVEAIEDFTKVLEISPQLETHIQGADVYELRGLAYRNLNKFEEAILDYKKAIALNPTRATIYYNLGNAYQDLGSWNQDKKQFEFAIESYSKAIEIEPGDEKSRFNRGNCYAKNGQYEKAISELERLPFNSVSGYVIAVSYEKLGKKDKAIETYSKLLKLEEETESPNSDLGKRYREKIEDYDNAYRFEIL